MNESLTIAQAYSAVQNLMHSWQVLDITPMTVLEAVRGMHDHQLHFWDALIWASARLAQISVVLSEDLPSASILEGVRFTDPFAADFQEERL
jgi:predicted nucleic acid-binding protein